MVGSCRNSRLTVAVEAEHSMYATAAPLVLWHSQGQVDVYRRSSEHTSESLIQPRDYGYAVLLWVYLQV